MEELSAITEVSESGHSTHTTFRSSEGEEGGAAEEPVPRKRWVGGACGERGGEGGGWKRGWDNRGGGRELGSGDMDEIMGKRRVKSG